MVKGTMAENHHLDTWHNFLVILLKFECRSHKYFELMKMLDQAKYICDCRTAFIRYFESET